MRGNPDLRLTNYVVPDTFQIQPDTKKDKSVDTLVKES